MIYFQKTFAYPLRPSSGDVFAYLNGITEQRLDPPSLQPHSLNPSTPVLFYSPLARVVTSLAPNPHQQRQMLPELREIPFSLTDLCTRAEWHEGGSALIRQRFVDAFIRNALPCSHAELEGDIQSLLRHLYSASDTTVVSHSFRLKLLQAYLATHGELFQTPTRLREWILPEQKTFDWGEGFSAEPSLLRNLTR